MVKDILINRSAPYMFVRLVMVFNVQDYKSITLICKSECGFQLCNKADIYLGYLLTLQWLTSLFCEGAT